MPYDQLAPARLERAEIGIGGIEITRRRASLLLEVRKIVVRVDPVRIVEDEILEDLGPEAERSGQDSDPPSTLRLV